MNKRIKSAVLMAKIVKYDPITMERSEKLDPEKFAELIVRESLVDFYRHHLDTTSNEDITIQVERYVQEHFGVEE